MDPDDTGAVGAYGEDIPHQQGIGFRGSVRVFEYLVLWAALVFVLLGTDAKSLGDTATSRLATVWSLTRHHTFYIDRPAGEAPNPFEQRTVDKAMANGRLISTKPPILPLLMTGEYIVMRKLLGWQLERPDDVQRLVWVMSVTLVGGAYLITLLFFLRTLRFVVQDPAIRVLLALSLAFCTQLWGYSTTINNHVPAAGALMVALYFAVGLGTGKLAPAAWRFFLFGLAGGLTITLDMPAGVFVFLAGVFLLRAHPRATLGWGALGAALPLGVHVAVMLAVTGSPLPVQVHRDWYLYESSYWRHPRGVDALNEPKLTYLFHMTFGRAGIFVLYPILLLGPAAALRSLVRRQTPYRWAVLAGAGGFMLLTAYYVLRTNNYGGEAYGFRWYIAAMPVLLLMGAPLLDSVRSRWKWIFISLMIGVSLYSAWECTMTPWRANQAWPCRFLGTNY